MRGDEIRSKFLAFFAAKGHTVVESDSLVPKDDPTVLFTTAGMQQFKRQFLGHIEQYTCAASSQKCLRTDDLDKVGKTDFHHTFFEMLGNFSFGDYFKREAIVWAWEFLTEELRIPKGKLWVSVYTDDSEAEAIWLKEVKMEPKKIIRLGDKSNFWPAEAKEKGPNGPCGPCSEIFYDYGLNKNCRNKNCDPSCHCGRFSEIWNLVFTQFDRKEGGILEPLPNKNIDTGMGLERLAAVVQGKRSNFDTDLFAPILEAIHHNVPQLELMERRIIADHIRAITFGIADGVVPSNKERGYVIKGLISKCINIALDKKISSPCIYKIVPAVIEAMKAAYPELQNQEKEIKAIIHKVEADTITIRKENLPKLKVKLSEIRNLPKSDQGHILGKIIFTYYDTHGLNLQPILAATDASGIDFQAKDAGLKIYEELMKKQKQQSRASSKMTGDVFTATDIDLNVPKTEFTGYDDAERESSSAILKMFIDQRPVNEIAGGDHVKIILDRTPFYAEAGGQVGDTGYISHASGQIRVNDTQKIDDVYLHQGIVEKGIFRTNDQVKAHIDFPRRMSIMRHHTATHILQAALRSILGSHVQQQGSLVAEDRLRFDFTHPKAITQEEIERIEQYVNERILNCDTVTKDILPIEQARKSGALAFFAEKYGKTVRVVSINGYSKEFCGGTHLDSTGQIGLFKIISESAIAQGIRRLEAKAGAFAIQYMAGQEKELLRISKLLKAPAGELFDKLSTQSKRLKQLEKDIAEYRFESIRNSIDAILQDAEKSNGIQVISHAFKDVDMELLRRISDVLKRKSKSAIILLGAHTEESASILLAVSDDLIKKGYKANELIQDIAPLINGRGGGRPQLAQAGSKETQKVEHAIKAAGKLIKEKIKK